MGKGTHCKKLAEELHVIHVSVGDLLRDEVKKEGSKGGDTIHSSMLAGVLVPHGIVQRVLEEFLGQMVAQGNKRFLVDGFPRSVEQAKAFEDRVSI